MPTALELTEFDLTVLLMVAVLVAIAATYLRLPYTVALVVVGLFIGLGDILHLELSQSVILLVFLPPLLFDGAVNMDVTELRLRWRQVGVLATAGTLLSAFVIAIVLHEFTALDWDFAFLLAVMLSPTDPVSVLAIFKEHGAPHGLRTLLEGESIFNDAVGIVLFTIALEIAFPGAAEEHITLGGAVFEFGREVFIGAAVGLVAGSMVYRLMSTIDDHLIEIMLSVVLAIGSYLVADRLGGSGLIATVSAGLVLGTLSPGTAMSPSSRLALLQVWEVIAFLANSALFLLIGLQFDLARLREADTALVAGVAIIAMLGARVLVVYGLLGGLSALRRDDRVSVSWMHALFWGGLRGSIPIALVLGLGARQFGEIDPVAVVFAVVFVSLVGQGLTYGPLLRRLGLSGRDDDFVEYEEQMARSLAIRAAIRQLDALHASGELIVPTYEAMRAGLEAGDAAARAELGRLAELPGRGRPVREARAMRQVAAAQLSALSDAARRGLIAPDLVEQYARRLNAVDTAEELLAVIDLELPGGDVPA